MVAYLALVREVSSRDYPSLRYPGKKTHRLTTWARLASSSEIDLQRTRVEYFSEPSMFNLDEMEVDSVDIGPS